MKTNLFFKKTVIGIFALMFTLTVGCKKDKLDEKPDTGSMQQLAKDELAVQSADDEALADVNDYMSGNINKQISAYHCNVTVDSSSIVNDTITYNLTFNGLNCAGTRSRVGTALVKKHINTHWIDVDATVQVTYVNLKVTKVSTGKWVILNGSKTFKNVSGGLVSQLGNGTITSIVHEITGTMNATFEDNTVRTWQVARRRTFSGTIGQLVVTHEGFGTANGYNNLVTWGLNRHGENFYTQINQGVVFKETCGWDPCAGIKVHHIPADNKQATITFGYDDNDLPISGTTCPTKYKLDWVKNSNSGTIFLSL